MGKDGLVISSVELLDKVVARRPVNSPDMCQMSKCCIFKLLNLNLQTVWNAKLFFSRRTNEPINLREIRKYGILRTKIARKKILRGPIANIESIIFALLSQTELFFEIMVRDCTICTFFFSNCYIIGWSLSHYAKFGKYECAYLVFLPVLDNYG